MSADTHLYGQVGHHLGDRSRTGPKDLADNQNLHSMILGRTLIAELKRMLSFCYSNDSSLSLRDDDLNDK